MNNRIIYQNTDGIASIIIPSTNWKGTMDELAAKDVPEGVAFDIIDEAELPIDGLFRNAWLHDKSSKGIKTDLPVAKEIAHDKRRSKRAELFAPLDIEATIPAKTNQAEAARQVIRDEDAIKQTAIDNAVDEDELRAILATL